MAKWQKRLAQLEKQKKEQSERRLQKPTVPAPAASYPVSDPYMERIEAKIQEFAKRALSESSLTPKRVSVSLTGTLCEIGFHSFYSEPNITFDFLSKFSEFFQTRNINLPSVSKEEGCSSCGHGSDWSFYLEIRDIARDLDTI